MPIDPWAAIVPVGLLLLAASFAVRLITHSRADPKFELLHSLIRALDERATDTHYKKAA